MNRTRLLQLLQDVKSGTLDVDNAAEKLSMLPFEDLGYARVDHHRAIRQGWPEVIYCAGKTPVQVAGIVESMMHRNSPVLATRASPETFSEVKHIAPRAVYNETAKIITLAAEEEISVPAKPSLKNIAVVTAGTSDIPVAEEAAVTAEFLGNRVDRIYDVGVAGIHRLISTLDRLRSANVLIVVAGMEGALASVVGGLVERPVIAVPTSVGYGASFNGIAALLTMLNSCASGVSVVNIDNGFGAGYTAAMINRI
ncbi:MAG TPA: nickel pincer cofactor biosynthesis protein LarB [Clostridiales bacterium]|nr:nickel pincer cofactor biosynthesis protein LarB [Clostridiales bacterium]